MDEPTDPREVGGDIAGPGGPHDWGQVITDASRAVLFDAFDVSLVDPVRDGEQANDPILAMLFQGRINKTDERARILILTNEDGAAGIITQLIALTYRAGWGDEFRVRLAQRWADLMREGDAEP